MNNPPLVVFLLVVSHVFWGFVFFGQPEFVEFANLHQTPALLTWMGISTTIPVCLLLAAAIGLGWGVEPSEDYTPGPTHGRYFQPGKNDWKRQDFNSWLKAKGQYDERDDWVRLEEEKRKIALGL